MLFSGLLRGTKSGGLDWKRLIAIADPGRENGHADPRPQAARGAKLGDFFPPVPMAVKKKGKLPTGKS